MSTINDDNMGFDVPGNAPGASDPAGDAPAKSGVTVNTGAKAPAATPPQPEKQREGSSTAPVANPPVPQGTAEDEDAPLFGGEIPKLEDLPDDLRSIFAAIKEVDAIVILPKGKSDKRYQRELRHKEALLAVLRKKCFQLQQGTSGQIVMGANEIAKQFGKNADVQAQRIESRARSDRDIAGLLDEKAKLNAEVERLKAALAEKK